MNGKDTTLFADESSCSSNRVSAEAVFVVVSFNLGFVFTRMSTTDYSICLVIRHCDESSRLGIRLFFQLSIDLRDN